LRRVAERRVDHRVLESLGKRVRPVDPVLALVVDARRASGRASGLARRLHRPCAHQRAATPGGLAGAELARGVDEDADALGIDLQLLDRDLAGDRVHALAHLGPAVTDLDRAVLLAPHDRAGDLLEAVAEARVLQP